MDIKEIKLDSLKIAMIKIPYTFALFLIAILPFFVYVHSLGKFNKLSVSDLQKILYIIIAVVVVLFASYYAMRFYISKKNEHHFAKAELNSLIIFSIFLCFSFCFYTLDCFLNLNGNQNIAVFWVLYSFGFVCAIVSSIFEYKSKLYVTNEIINTKLNNNKPTTNNSTSEESDDEEIIIKKQIRESE